MASSKSVLLFSLLIRVSRGCFLRPTPTTISSHRLQLLSIHNRLYHTSTLDTTYFPSSLPLLLSKKYSGSDFSNTPQNNMPRGVKKENLPTKVCVVCERPFNWRKKWERCWDEVTTCSKSCNKKRKEKSREFPSLLDASGSDVKLQSQKSNSNDQNSIGNCGVTYSIDSDDGAILVDSNVDVATLIHGNLQLDSDSDSVTSHQSIESETIMDAKAQRKAEKKLKKAERRAQREGRGDPTAGQKQCTLCNKSVNLLIRCTYDRSGEWGMVCGKCWNDVSGGVVDGDGAHPYYRYGGLWKNRRAQP